MAKDLTVGNPLKQIVLFALPLYFGSIFQQVYNIIDTAIVGRFLGSVPLAGVGAASPVINFLVSLLVGFSVGGSIAIARLFGEHDAEKTAQVVKTIVTASFVIALAISVSGIIFARPLLGLLGTPADAMPYALIYLRIVLAGMLFTVFFNQLSGMLRGLGNSKTPLYFLIFSSCVNIVLDLVFIVLLDWGVSGAAWATVIAQAISCALMVFYIARRVPELHFSLRGTPVSRESLQLVLRYGLPMGLQQSSISLGHVLMQGIVNTTSTATVSATAVMAAYASATKIDLLAVMPMVNLASALSTYAAQCAGKGEMARIRTATRTVDGVTVALCVVLAVLFICFRTPLISVFLDADESLIAAQAITAGTLFLLTTPPFYWVLGLVHNHLNAMAGTGDTVFYMAVMIGMMLLRVALAWVFVHPADMGYFGIWVSFPASWAIACAVVMVCYRRRSRTW